MMYSYDRQSKTARSATWNTSLKVKFTLLRQKLKRTTDEDFDRIDVWEVSGSMEFDERSIHPIIFEVEVGKRPNPGPNDKELVWLGVEGYGPFNKFIEESMTDNWTDWIDALQD